jgi:hypothetical protein
MDCANRDAIYRRLGIVFKIASMESKRNSIGRSPIMAERVRKIEGGFSFVPHRFLHEGFFASLSRDELLLYFFLALAGDRNGVSFYGLDAICTLLDLSNDLYLVARNGLIEKDLLAFDGRRFQLLSLPNTPCHKKTAALETQDDFEERDPATIRQILHREFGIGAKRKEAAT